MNGKRLPPALFSLPTELLLHIGAYLVAAADLNSLLRTSRHFAHVYSSLFFHRALAGVDRRSGRSVLHWAAATGRDKLLASLLNAGVNVNTVDNNGTTPLESAVLLTSEMAVRRLLKSGADTKHRNREGWAALHLAAVTGNVVIAELLLGHGADIAARSSAVLRKHPFHDAVLLGHVCVAKLFLEQGADVDAGDVIGMTVAQKAAVAGHEGIVELLFGTAAAAAAIVANEMVKLLVPLVPLEITIVRRQLGVLFRAEDRARRFCCTTD